MLFRIIGVASNIKRSHAAEIRQTDANAPVACYDRHATLAEVEEGWLCRYRRGNRSPLLAILFLAAASLATPALADGGLVALVVGNSAYQKMPQLPNATADAKAIAEVLSKLGFENGHVEPLLNVDINTFVKAARSFGDRLRDARIGVIYYSGHGMQVDEGGDTQNYLIPVDADLSDIRDAKRQALPLQELLSESHNPAAAVIAMLDACRDNPAVSRLPGAGTRGVPRSGLKPIDKESLPAGTLVSYATAAGKTADDGNGRNSPYATALIRNLPSPNQDISLVLRHVRNEVLTSTSYKQEPEFVDHLLDGVILAPLHDSVTPAPTQEASPLDAAKLKTEPPQNDLARDRLLYEAVKDSNRREDLEAYLQQFPNGLFKGLVSNRLALLAQPGIAPAQSNGAGHDIASQQDGPPRPGGQSNVALLVPPPNQSGDASHHIETPKSIGSESVILPRPQETRPVDAQQPDGSRRPSFEAAVKKVIAPSAFQVADSTINGNLAINLDHISDQDQSFTMIRENSQVMKQYLAEHGNTVKCYAHTNKRFECYAQNQDMAELALRMGAARAAPDAPLPYREAEQEARKAQRGIWRAGAYSQK